MGRRWLCLLETIFLHERIAVSAQQVHLRPRHWRQQWWRVGFGVRRQRSVVEPFPGFMIRLQRRTHGPHDRESAYARHDAVASNLFAALTPNPRAQITGIATSTRQSPMAFTASRSLTVG